MAAYRRVYDSHHLQADCQEPGSARNPTLGNAVWAAFFTGSHILDDGEELNSESVVPWLPSTPSQLRGIFVLMRMH